MLGQFPKLSDSPRGVLSVYQAFFFARPVPQTVRLPARGLICLSSFLFRSDSSPNCPTPREGTETVFDVVFNFDVFIYIPFSPRGVLAVYRAFFFARPVPQTVRLPLRGHICLSSFLFRSASFPNCPTPLEGTWLLIKLSFLARPVPQTVRLPLRGRKLSFYD